MEEIQAGINCFERSRSIVVATDTEPNFRRMGFRKYGYN